MTATHELSPELARQLDETEAEVRASTWSHDPERKAKASDRHIWTLAAAEWEAPGTIESRSKARGRR
jgi:hypothetical protein